MAYAPGLPGQDSLPAEADATRPTEQGSWHTMQHREQQSTMLPAQSATSAAEDDGWLLSLCYDATKCRSELVILGAQQIEAGPIATLPLQSTIPPGLHGTWDDTHYGPVVV